MNYGLTEAQKNTDKILDLQRKYLLLRDTILLLRERCFGKESSCDQESCKADCRYMKNLKNMGVLK